MLDEMMQREHRNEATSAASATFLNEAIRVPSRLSRQRLAMRIASFDRQAIADIKRLVNIASLPPDIDIAPEWDAFIDSVGRPAAQTRIRALKSQCTGRKVISSLTQLRQMIVSHMRQLQKLPLLVRSFFHAPLCVRLSGNYFAKLN